VRLAVRDRPDRGPSSAETSPPGASRPPAKEAVDACVGKAEGDRVQFTDTKTYNNGVKIVPSYLLKPVSVDVSNWKPVLIDSGCYEESQIR
jgi:putative multiple sugar transport system substrate-binding protein